MTTVILRAGGLPIGQKVCSLTLPYYMPERFLECFGEATGAMLFSYWTTFMDVSHEIETVLSVISPKEKEWLQKNYDSFFFGVPDKDAEYDFFTTESVMPLKFFTIASRIDLVKLGECARRLGAIVDDAYRNWDALTFILFKDDFVWEEQGLTFMISSQEHVTHKREADFFIDIGGNNTFLTNAGGTQGKRAAALHIDYFRRQHVYRRHLCAREWIPWRWDPGEFFRQQHLQSKCVFSRKRFPGHWDFVEYGKQEPIPGEFWRSVFCSLRVIAPLE